MIFKKKVNYLSMFYVNVKNLKLLVKNNVFITITLISSNLLVILLVRN